MTSENNDYKTLQQHLRVSQSVFRIAKSFVSLDCYRTVIERALKNLGEAASAARAYLFLFDREEQIMNNSHEWCREGVIPEIENLQGLPLNIFPWWMSKLSKGEIIDVEDVDSIGEQGRAEREILQQQGIKSVLVLPVEIDGSLIGFVGLDNVESSRFWDGQTKEYLRVAADMIGMAVRKHESENQILAQKEELEKAYDNLKRTQIQLINSEKLAGIGQLAAGVAHEINNPVGFVISNTDTLKSYYDSLKNILELYRKREDVEKIRREEEKEDLEFVLEDFDVIIEDNLEGLHRIAEIVKNLREFSRIDDKETFVQANIHEGLKSALLLAGNEIKYFADVKTEFGDVPLILCDAGALNQVFLNIFVNAAQAIQEQQRPSKGVITIKTYREEELIVCEIGDDGPGISESMRGKIFDPFFTTKEVGKGTGLGLSISYDIIVNKHGGSISVDTSEMGGALFRISLPIRTKDSYE